MMAHFTFMVQKSVEVFDDGEVDALEVEFIEELEALDYVASTESINVD